MYLERNGQFRTDSLFVERIAKRHKKAGTTAVYCLSERMNNKDVSRLYDIFINSVDEYDFAIKAFGSKAHLDKLKELKWFNEGWAGCATFRGYAAWLEDMQERDRSLAKQVLVTRAKEGDVSAAKKLADMNKPVKGVSAGRPKAADIKREAAIIAEEQAEIDDDLKRLGVIPIRG